MRHSTLIYGVRPIIEAINSGAVFEKVYLQNTVAGPQLKDLKSLLNKNAIAYNEVPQIKLDKLVQFKNHQGAVGLISPVGFQEVETILPEILASGRAPFFLVLDRITDVRNFGAIARTAECAGVDAIIVPIKESAAVNEDAIKTSAGALLKIPVCKTASLFKTVKFLIDSGIKVVGASEKAETVVYNADLTGPLAIVLGSEEDGISRELLKLVGTLVKIPLQKEIASLNVSVAAGITMFEAVRQNSLKDK
ncbi:MAG: 23S rRNA (guanosine(2251)-2'-O)-methyltransferase RlmB [Bacteroidia bacterium]|nr:23S rRNA (guanosine(2251)-2'-O)-methyltransferase RlmB [Bacteroidia bacterium]